MINRRRPSRSEGLAEQCGAFLSGHLRELAESSGLRPPRSAWINALAHMEVEELRRLAGQGFDPAPGQADRWAQATSFLAAEVLRAGGDDDGAVRRIQVEILVPIELRWTSRDVALRTPSDFVREVREALERSLRRQGRSHSRQV